MPTHTHTQTHTHHLLRGDKGERERQAEKKIVWEKGGERGTKDQKTKIVWGKGREKEGGKDKK